MLVTLLGLALVAIAAFYVAWPLLSRSETAEPAAPPASNIAILRKEKDAALTAIREADFDHQVGKLSEEDYAATRSELEARALGAMKALDELGVASDAPALRAVPSSDSPAAAKAGGRRFCSACGQALLEDASFCAGCGAKRPHPGRSSGRRRATP